MGFGYGNTTYHGGQRGRDIETDAIVQTVFSNSMVAHIWAQGTQTFGRSNNGNFYFEGPLLYSYGSHYIVGFLLDDGTAFINSDSVSPTTSQHCGDARAAVRQRYYSVPDLTSLVVNGLLRHDLTRRDRGHAESHIFNHAAGYSDESAVAVLIAAGHKPGPRVAALVARLKAKAAKAAERHAARDAKREMARTLNDAKRAAGLSDAEWQEGRDKALRDTYESKRYTGRTDLNGRGPVLSRDMLQWQKAAKARGWTRVAAVLSERRKDLRAALQLRERQLARKAARRYLGTRVTFVRTFRNMLTRGEPLNQSYDYRQFADSCGWIAEHGPATKLAKARLNALASAAFGEAERLAPIEKAAADVRREREARERFERETRARTDWLEGKPGRWHGSDERGGAMLRAVDVTRDESGRIDGGTLQTSHGADCPLLPALKAFAFVRRVVVTGQGWNANGHTIKVGHFRVDSIAADGTMKAGCHTLHLAEMERLAGLLGVADIKPDDSALEPSHAAA